MASATTKLILRNGKSLPQFFRGPIFSGSNFYVPKDQLLISIQNSSAQKPIIGYFLRQDGFDVDDKTVDVVRGTIQKMPAENWKYALADCSRVEARGRPADDDDETDYDDDVKDWKDEDFDGEGREFDSDECEDFVDDEDGHFSDECKR